MNELTNVVDVLRVEPTKDVKKMRALDDDRPQDETQSGHLFFVILKIQIGISPG